MAQTGIANTREVGRANLSQAKVSLITRKLSYLYKTMKAHWGMCFDMFILCVSMIYSHCTSLLRVVNRTCSVLGTEALNRVRSR